MFFLCRENVVSGCAAADKKGMGKQLQVGPVMRCLIVFTWKFTLLFQEGDLIIQVFLWSYFCFHEPDTYI